MIFDAIIDDKYSMRDFKMYITSRPIIPVAKRNIELIDIPGRDGSLTKFKGYRDREVSIPFKFLDYENISRRIREITPILLNAKKIVFNDDFEIFYKIKSVEIEDVERSLRVIGSFVVKFIVDPFSYFTNNEIIEVIKDISIFNAGTYKSQPHIKIYGNGNLQVSINSNTFQIDNVEEYVEIDSELLICYKKTINKGPDMIGEFPILYIGENNITLSSNITKVEITPNWRFL